MNNNLRHKIARIIMLDNLQLLNDFDVDGDIYRMDPECADGAYATADAIIAALPGLVKPLQWSDCAEYSTCLTDSDYSIKYWAKEKLWVDRYTTMRRHETLEAAKAAAQKHHVAQVMAAFGIEEEQP